MESGYAFLHPRNIFQQHPKGLKADYRSIPFSIWRPCIPAIERHIPPVGAAAWLYRLLRVTWVVITLPSWIGLVLLAEILRLPNDTLPPSILPRRPTWTLWQRLTYPLLARAVWSVTFGLPPAASPLDEEGITFPARWWYGRGTDIIPVDLSFASSDEGKLWIQDEAVDPAGIAMPQAHLPGFWIAAKSIKQAKPDRYENVQVVLYIVGGGYITGHPLEASRVFDIARFSGKRVLGMNYRKAVSRHGAFPAGLQDTIAAYAYLLREGYTNIAVAGDSAGGGLALALMQYIARLASKSNPPANLRMPVKAFLSSPWVDLTFASPVNETVYFDIIHPTMLGVAASAYTSSVTDYKAGESPRAPSGSIAEMGRAHPFFSPALASAVPSLKGIAPASRKLDQQPPDILIFYGDAELFASQCIKLAANLKEAGLPTDVYCGVDETHGFILVPTFMSPKIRPALEYMGRWLAA